MSEPEVLTLDWHGPVLPMSMSLDAVDMDRLTGPGVYLCVQRYDNVNRIRVYAGVTKDFRLRLREHVAATLALTYDIADENGRVVFRHTHKDSLFDAVRDADYLHPLALLEVKRMAWFCALDDSDPYIPWHVVEGMLIRRLKSASLAGEMTSAGDVIDVVNERGGPTPEGPVALRNQGAEEAIDILGETLSWPLEDAA